MTGDLSLHLSCFCRQLVDADRSASPEFQKIYSADAVSSRCKSDLKKGNYYYYTTIWLDEMKSKPFRGEQNSKEIQEDDT